MNENSEDRDIAGLVLVVEDEFLIAMELEATLTGAGYSVLGPVGTVADALKLLNEQRPDAVVLDVNLRGRRASAVAQELVDRGIPYLVASAYHSIDLANEPLFCRVANVGKPTSPNLLLLELGRVLRPALKKPR